jgi:hypothetical protein
MTISKYNNDVDDHIYEMETKIILNMLEIIFDIGVDNMSLSIDFVNICDNIGIIANQKKYKNINKYKQAFKQHNKLFNNSGLIKLRNELIELDKLD